MNESEIIKYILNEDIGSPQKKAMNDGVRYYNGQHDVFRKRLSFSDDRGNRKQKNGKRGYGKKKYLKIQTEVITITSPPVP